ncbi:MAG: M1 family metallopeptidase [Clostridia bacterium]|nr:M1 family metallopeptidase [Clostridia bacterium]
MKKFISLLLIVCAVAATLSFSACAKKQQTVSSYDIIATYDGESGTLTGTVDFTYYNCTDNEISELKFNLFGNAFRQDALYSPVSDAYSARAYYAGKSYGSMTVEGVENCSAWNVGGEDENILSVTLISPVYPEQTASVKISYTLILAKVNHRTGITANTVNLGNFYPVLCAYTTDGFAECNYYSCGDPFLSECANYTVTLTMPLGFTAAASGELISSTETADAKKCTYSLNCARDFALVLSDRFQVETGNVNGVDVSYYYYKDDNPQASLAVACESLEYFSDTFGGYTYPTLSVVQTGFCYGGMEYPALTMISDSLDGDTAAYTIVHENAHQWWYAMVGSDQLNCAWQDEGLAEYSSVMFFESHPDYNFTRTGLVGTATKAYRAYYSVYNQIFGDVNTGMTRNLKDFESDYEYANIAYNKGMIMFETLRQSIGDEKFSAGLKKYFKNNLNKIATQEDLFGCFISAGVDLDGFFQSFIDGKIVI